MDTTLDEWLDRCVAYHGHLCMGQALGVRLALKGMELVGTRDPKRMIVFIEIDRCIADAIQVVTGTRIGRRSAKLVNVGKMAATFLDPESGRAWRVNVAGGSRALGHGEEACRAALRIPDEELLAWRPVRVRVEPMDMPGKPMRKVACARCGEKVFDGKDVAGPEGPLCPSCATGAYWTEPEPESA